MWLRLTHHEANSVAMAIKAGSSHRPRCTPWKLGNRFRRPLRRVSRRRYASRARAEDSPDTSKASTVSEAEQFVGELTDENAEEVLEATEVEAIDSDMQSLRDEVQHLEERYTSLQEAVDQEYRNFFKRVKSQAPMGESEDKETLLERLEQLFGSMGQRQGGDAEAIAQLCENMTEGTFQKLGRDNPELFQKLLRAAREDVQGWEQFQQESHDLQLQRDRVQSQLNAKREELDRAMAISRMSSYERRGGVDSSVKRIVLISGFESFNVNLYRRVAENVRAKAPNVELVVFSDRDVRERPGDVDKALDGADAFFGSLLFDFDQVEWLKERLQQIPVRLIFESALELTGMTQVGEFSFGGGQGQQQQQSGPPKPVKALLKKFGSGKEEDRLVGYLSFLKIGPKLLRFIPKNKKLNDLRNWLQIYAYWNEGGEDNVEQAMVYLANSYLTDTGVKPGKVMETPNVGCYHPDRELQGLPYLENPNDYLAWYRQEKDPPSDAPVVAVLLYRKHVITKQLYLMQVVSAMEEKGLIPVPIFINGVEAHTVVRDMLTTKREQDERARGNKVIDSLRKDAIEVDAVVSTIGFPLVGGPAGSSEGGRNTEVAKTILQAKDVPYFVASPLLIQDIESWNRNGVAGLQTVVLYSLPELDGSIDAYPLGGLVKDDIFVAKERVYSLCDRINKWVALQRKPEHEKKLAVLVYGFPPGVGATGTAALLNVPRSIDRLMERLQAEGYKLRESPNDPLPSGDAIVEALRTLEDDGVAYGGIESCKEAVRKYAERNDVELGSARVEGEVVSPEQLEEWLTLPPEWGPTEYGPMPFLPQPDRLARGVEKTWGHLGSKPLIRTAGTGGSVVSGIQVGNVFFGVQPLLGIEGDPMRLLFERDLSPHPQYAAFYKWLQKRYDADAMIHLGMHGTMEWLSGTPLGNNALSWPDAMAGAIPNLYVYAVNNPSESVLAKRRGYATLVSYNVPPYSRAGLYKQLADLRAVLQDFRGEGGEGPKSDSGTLKKQIGDLVEQAGLQADVPIPGMGDDFEVNGETVEQIPEGTFEQWSTDLYNYLMELENTLFSEGLHTLGQRPDEEKLASYLDAYYEGDLPSEAIQEIVRGGEVAEARKALERAYKMSPGDDDGVDQSKLEEAKEIADLLNQTDDELSSLVRGLRGQYIKPSPGGDLIRDGPGVLPTGRNIHAIDPYRMPTPAALERGRQAARQILEQHRASNNGVYPGTVTVNLWGLDSIKTKGESIGTVLELVGAEPVKEGTGRIIRYELKPLEELDHPRIDVLCNMSGIFRDTFSNIVTILDDMFRAASEADEPEGQNYIRKHALAMEDQGLENVSARLFSNPPGDFGSFVNEQVGAGNWENPSELGETWVSRNSFSYGRGGEQGQARPEVLREVLKSTERVVQNVDSVEYGLTDIQEYYANTGALVKAAESAKQQADGSGKKKSVACSIVESYNTKGKPKELDETLRREYRTKLLNPKWQEAMAEQGSGGAYEISQRLTALVGWGATADFKENWVWDGAYESYIDNDEMREKLRRNNPQAFANAVRRFLEAAGRGMWTPSQEQLDRLQELYSDVDSQLEGVQ